MRTVSDKIYRENQNFCVQKRPFANRAVYDILYKNMLESDRPQVTVWRMRIV